MLVILRQHYIQLLDHARRAHPQECCGVLIGARAEGAHRVERVLPATNVAADRTSTFQIDWATLLRAATSAQRRTGTIVGFYHSHPDGSTRPSPQDAAAAWPEMCNVIVTGTACAYDTVTGWARTFGNGTMAHQDVCIIDDALIGRPVLASDAERRAT